jgi:hypothetical protein
VAGKRHYVHRLAYCEAHAIDIEDIVGQVVMHTCDNPACINPEHLRLGTQADNLADMLSKGRHASAHRTHCPHGHKYTPKNTRITRRQRVCRACERDRKKKRVTILTCEYCGDEFKRPNDRGPIPRYCSPAHRQAAHRVRMVGGDASHEMRVGWYPKDGGYWLTCSCEHEAFLGPDEPLLSSTIAVAREHQLR